ncbi:tetratricopeptide repeat protein [Sphingobacterium oryzagri]|uniref:Tetratricopeptide repeat protein n=1 Tax=Sphingobacterium oryzagri TaxID=3025669 RepID=A0ABY7WJ28_9SPHI|nr:tetratricopeptide repeat protein [Sphingobacterium sp. KACC 22765]WDF69188.1 tetratricopeptide repeat protein [Sphingobacterium sp. KACC 22765]
MTSFRKIRNICFPGLQFIIIFSTLAYFVHTYFTASYASRFRYAEQRQGSIKSDYIFSVLGWQYPSNGDVLQERSVAFNKRGMYARGFHLLDSAVQMDPISHLGYRGWIKLHMLRDYEGALLDFSRLDSLTENHVDYPMSENIHFLKAICYDKLGNYEASLMCFDQAAESSYTGFVDYKINLYKAIVLFQHNNEAEATSLLLAVLKEYPKSSEASYFLAKIYQHGNQPEDAARYANQARNYYKQGYRLKNAYNEMPYEIYLEDIDLLISSL